MRQRVEGQGVVQLPVDGPRRERQGAQVALVQERLRALFFACVGRSAEQAHGVAWGGMGCDGIDGMGWDGWGGGG